MKNRTGHIIILILTILFLSSCSKEDLVIMPEYETSKVSFQLSVSENLSDRLNNTSNAEVLSKASAADTQTNVSRGSAPMNIDGIKMNVTHANGDLDEKSKEFYFSGHTDSNSSGEAANMEVYKGNNSFYVESMSSVEPENKAYKNKIDLFDEEDFEWDYYYEKRRWPTYSDLNKGKVDYYSEQLAEIHPIYSYYSGSVENLDIENNSSVNIPMTTNSARFSIVIEPSSYYYYITLVVSYKTNGKTKKYKIEHTIPGSASALILNDTDITEDTDLKIRLVFYDRYWKRNRYVYDKIEARNIFKSGKTKYTPKSGVNQTLVINCEDY